MGSVGDAYGNAMCESFFATLECELLARRRFTSQAEARMAVFTYIEGWYDPTRRHSGIRYLSPIAYEMQMLKQTETSTRPCQLQLPVGLRMVAPSTAVAAKSLGKA
jgi:putative transposase